MLLCLRPSLRKAPRQCSQEDIKSSMMTMNNEQERPAFRLAAEVKQDERTEATEEEIQAWVMRELEADQRTLELLATL